MVRNYKSKTKQDKARRENASIGRKSKDQKQNILHRTALKDETVLINTVKDFLSAAKATILDRIKCSNANTSHKAVKTRMACHHLLSIGSSQVHKLGQEAFDIETIHNRSDYIGARSKGSEWEDVWQTRKYFHCEGQRYNIDFTYKEPNRYSTCIPWICASPDFISKLSYNNTTAWSVIEIKSVSGKPQISKFLSQIRVAMSCFHIDLGFLVIYNTTEVQSPPKIIKVVGALYLEQHKSQLETQYYAFLIKCFTTLFGITVPENMVREALCLPETLVSENTFDVNMLQKNCVRLKKCYFWSPSMCEGKNWRKFVFRKGKPVGTYSNLNLNI